VIPRTLEPEVMDSVDEAEEYDRIDHSVVNERFVGDFLSAVAARPRAVRPLVVDVGAGTARVPLVLAAAWRECAVVAVDMAGEMLSVGVRNVRESRFDSRVLCVRADARRLPLSDGAAPFVISNSLIHHIPDPLPVLTEMCRVAAPGATLFVRDLFRPETDAEVERLVSTYATYETPAQRALFAASLRAALTVDEIEALVKTLPLQNATVVTSSDRHWILVGECRG
jgi:ubiquinone/menaquinone biosynthesis C-methylase UbiE